MPNLSRLAPFLALLVAAAVAVGGCGGDDNDDDGGGTPPEDLSAQLVAPSDIAVGAKLTTDREFQWTDPIDFAVEGIFVPQSVPGAASKTVHALEDAGFESGAGEAQATKDGSILAFVDVVKFDSDDGAAEARDYLNTNNLQQPCHGPCSVKPQQADTLGVPSAKSVHQVPIKGAELPPGAHPFEARIIEFTIGPFLYHLSVDGPPGLVSDSEWKQSVEAVYENAQKTTPSS